MARRWTCHRKPSTPRSGCAKPAGATPAPTDWNHATLTYRAIGDRTEPRVDVPFVESMDQQRFPPGVVGFSGSWG